MAEERQPSNSSNNTYLHYLVLRLRARVQTFLGPVLKKMRRKSLLRRERYIFTDKKHPERGMFSACLGVLSIIGIVLAIKTAYDRGGDAAFAAGVAVFLSFLFSVCGMVFGILSRREKDVFFLFPNTGIVLNLLSIAGCGALLALGILM